MHLIWFKNGILKITMTSRIEISTRTILFTVAVIAGGWLVIQIRDIIFFLFIAFIIMSVLRPVVDRMESWRLARALAILLIYAVLLSAVFVFGSVIVPPLVNESVKLMQNLPHYISQIAPDVRFNLETLIPQIAPVGTNVARFTVGIFSNVISIFTILVFSFYFLLEAKRLPDILNSLVGNETGKRVITVLSKAEKRMGAWVRGQLLLMLIIGQATFIGLSLLGVNYALPLALIAGTLEIFPFIGPNIAAIPAILVGFIASPGLGVLVAIMYFVIQQLENNIIVPAVLQRAVGVPPVISLIALMIGGRLAGVLGIILAVPILLVVQTVMEAVWKRKE